jgi:hypothetical protein
MLISLTLSAYSQDISKVFEKYIDDERFSYISLGKVGTGIAASIIGHLDNENQSMMLDMENMKILTLENDQPDKLYDSFTKDIDKAITSGHYEILAEIRDKGDRVNVYKRTDKHDNAEMLAVMRDKEEVTVIWMSGKAKKGHSVQ